MEKLVYLTILLPFMGAITAFLVGKFTERWNAFWVAVIFGGATLVSALYIAYYVFIHHGTIASSFN